MVSIHHFGLLLLLLILATGCSQTKDPSDDLLASDIVVKKTEIPSGKTAEKIIAEKRRPLKKRKPIPLTANKNTKPQICTSPQVVYPKDVLKPGERIKITVYREDDLSGVYEIGETGMTAFPLIGEIRAAGLTAPQLQEKIKNALKDGYLINPGVNVIAARCLDAQ